VLLMIVVQPDDRGLRLSAWASTFLSSFLNFFGINVAIEPADRGLCYVCTLTEGALHLKTKSANILKAYCTLTEGALHPRYKGGDIFKVAVRRCRMHSNGGCVTSKV